MKYLLIEQPADPFTVELLLNLVSKCWVSELPTLEPVDKHWATG